MRVRAAQAQGHKLVSLMRGEPDFRTPAHIAAAVAEGAWLEVNGDTGAIVARDVAAGIV